MTQFPNQVVCGTYFTCSTPRVNRHKSRCATTQVARVHRANIGNDRHHRNYYTDHGPLLVMHPSVQHTKCNVGVAMASTYLKCNVGPTLEF